MNLLSWGEVAILATDRRDGDMTERKLAARLVREQGGGKLVVPKQEHTDRVAALAELDAPADGVVLPRQSEVAAGVLTADCVPIVVWGESRLVVVHAGRRGLLSGVVESGLSELETDGSLSAYIGPSICRRCYEVRLTRVEREEAGGYYAAGRLDLGRLVRAKLEDGGARVVRQEERCTRCGGDYWSYRGGDGSRRFLTAAWWRLDG